MPSLPDIDAWIERQLSAAPPFTDEQAGRLRTLLWGVELAEPVAR